MHYNGILIGILTFGIIGIFHPIVIKTEYYIGKKAWPVFAVAGIVFLGISLYVESLFGQTICAVLGASCLWSIKELYEQEERVKKGWFPKNLHKKFECDVDSMRENYAKKINILEEM